MTDGARDPAETGGTPDLFSVHAVPGVDLVRMEFRLPGMAPRRRRVQRRGAEGEDHL